MLRQDQRRGGWRPPGELRLTGGGSEQGVKYFGNIVRAVWGLWGASEEVITVWSLQRSQHYYWRLHSSRAPPPLPRLSSHRTQLREPPMGSAGPPGSHWSAELYQPFIEHFYGNCVFTSSFIHQQNCVLTSIPICFITNHPHSMIKQKEDEYCFINVLRMSTRPLLFNYLIYNITKNNFHIKFHV